MFIKWLNPFFFQADGTEGGEAVKDPPEITDDTDIYAIEDPDQVDLILDRNDIDIDKYLDLVRSSGLLPEADRHLISFRG